MKRYVRTIRVAAENRDKLSVHQRSIVESANKYITKYKRAMKVLAQ